MATSIQDVLKVGRAEAVAVVREALATVPTDADPRAKFFVEWRTRTLQALEQTFQDGMGPAERLREIEFSPRRLSGDEDKDAPLRREACLAGCAAARRLLQKVLDRVETLPDAAAAGGPSADADADPSEPADALVFAAEPDAPAVAVVAPEATPPHSLLTNHLPEERMSTQTAMSSAPAPAPAAVNAPGSHRLASAARRSLGRALVAWERGDRDAAAVASARLLADLTLLTADPQFAGAFGDVMSRTAGAWADDPAGSVPMASQPPAPLAVWSLLVAMTRLADPQAEPAPAAAARPAA